MTLNLYIFVHSILHCDSKISNSIFDKLFKKPLATAIFGEMIVIFPVNQFKQASV